MFGQFLHLHMISFDHTSDSFFPSEVSKPKKREPRLSALGRGSRREFSGDPRIPAEVHDEAAKKRDAALRRLVATEETAADSLKCQNSGKQLLVIGCVSTDLCK